MPDNLKNNKLLFVGLPQSGKSTFIAALWHAIESGEVENTYELLSLPKDREYLNNLRTSWLRCKPLERNKVEASNEIVLELLDSKANVKTELRFPDLSGEMYNIQFESRKISLEYKNRLKDVQGVIVFVNPDNIKKPDLISDALSLLNTEQNESEEDEKNFKPWTHKDTPTQVILIDLLQMILPYIHHRFKIAIVISAWDVIKGADDISYRKIKPIEYLKKELPLLDQFLQSNDNSFISNVYGISAQGSNYEGGASAYAKLVNQSERIIVQFNDETTHDICLPIKWFINEG